MRALGTFACVYHKYSDINWHASLAQVLKCLRLQVCNTFLCLLSCSVVTTYLTGRDITLAFLLSRFGFGIISYWFYRLTGCMSVRVRVCVCVFVSLSFNDCLGFALSLPTRCRFHFQFSLSLLFTTQREREGADSLSLCAACALWGSVFMANTSSACYEACVRVCMREWTKKCCLLLCAHEYFYFAFWFDICS